MDTITIIYQTYLALPIHTTFSGLDCISRSRQGQTVVTEFFFLFISDQVETLYSCYIRPVDQEYATIFYILFSHMLSEIIDVFPHLKKTKQTLTVAFSRTPFRQDL